MHLGDRLARRVRVEPDARGRVVVEALRVADVLEAGGVAGNTAINMRARPNDYTLSVIVPMYNEAEAIEGFRCNGKNLVAAGRLGDFSDGTLHSWLPL